jgi:PilZ domain
MRPNQNKKEERRSEHRLGFQGVIPGQLRHHAKELRFVAFDISKKGLGILLSPCPEEGEEISLDLGLEKSQTLRFTIKHI